MAGSGERRRLQGTPYLLLLLMVLTMALLLVLALVGSGMRDLPGLNSRFLGFAMVGGISQIVATVCVVALFAERNFTVGITLKKTETMQTAIIALIVLGEAVSAWGLIAIAVGLVGVLLLSDPPKTDIPLRWQARVFNRASGFGMASGALFGVSATGYRGASLALGGDGDFLIRAATTLAFVTLFQSLVMVAEPLVGMGHCGLHSTPTSVCPLIVRSMQIEYVGSI